MDRRRILVVDASPAMRETLCVLLGGTYEVRAAAPSELGHVVDLAPDLVIASASLRGSDVLPAAVRRLWLGGPAELGGIPRRFTPTDLRRQIAAALDVAPQRAEDEQLGDELTSGRNWRLDTPFLDERSKANTATARSTGLALHIVGEPGSGKDALARAILGNRPPYVCDEGNPVPPLADLADDTAILAIGVDRWPNGARRALSALLDSPAGQRLRIVSTATEDIGALADEGAFLPDLYYRLTLLTVRLAPLRERPDDIPAIAAAAAAEIADNLGRPRPIFSEGALLRLSRYLWFGNLAELQAVLTRTLALSDTQRIEADDLRFAADQAPLEAPPATDQAPPASVGTAAAEPTIDGTGSNLKLIIHELAHEFKNPLVTIKTFTQHCRKTLLESEPDAEEFANMTGRAVDQMDDTIENLLTFARMSRPSPRNVSLSTLLAPVFANGTDLPVDYTEPPPVTVRVDPEQTAYAVENLIRALARDRPADVRLRAEFGAPDMLLCRLPPEAVGTRDKLKHLVADDDDAEPGEEMPLGIAIASAILQRNGAELRMNQDGDPKTVMIRFPLVENEEKAEANRDGTSPRIDR